MEIENENPLIYEKANIVREEDDCADDCMERQSIDALEVFNLIRNINDPEHPLTLEELNVVNLDHIEVKNNGLYTLCNDKQFHFSKTYPVIF